MEINGNRAFMSNPAVRHGVLILEPNGINRPNSQVNRNIISTTYAGVTNWNRDNLQIGENIISIVQPPPNTTFAGIKVLNANRNYVFCNEITGTSNASFDAQFGIWGDVNTNTTYSCNELNMLGRGFNMTGPQPMNTRLQVNHMTNTNVGIAIDQNGIIGPQGVDNVNLGLLGFASFPFDNCWNSGDIQ